MTLAVNQVRDGGGFQGSEDRGNAEWVGSETNGSKLEFAAGLWDVR